MTFGIWWVVFALTWTASYALFVILGLLVGITQQAHFGKMKEPLCLSRIHYAKRVVRRTWLWQKWFLIIEENRTILPSIPHLCSWWCSVRSVVLVWSVLWQSTKPLGKCVSLCIQAERSLKKCQLDWLWPLLFPKKRELAHKKEIGSMVVTFLVKDSFL